MSITNFFESSSIDYIASFTLLSKLLSLESHPHIFIQLVQKFPATSLFKRPILILILLHNGCLRQSPRNVLNFSSCGTIKCIPIPKRAGSFKAFGLYEICTFCNNEVLDGLGRKIGVGTV